MVGEKVVAGKNARKRITQSVEKRSAMGWDAIEFLGRRSAKG
jgi:hypothetical protein